MDVEVTTGLGAVARALADASPRGFAAVTLEGRFTYWNPRAELILGWAPQQVLGRVDPTAMSDQDRLDTLAVLADVAAGLPGPTGQLLRRRAADGRVVDVVIDAYVPLGDPVEEVGLWFGPHVPSDEEAGWREMLSRELVQALTLDDVASVVSIGLEQLLGPSVRAVVYAEMAGSGLVPRLHIGPDGAAAAPVLAVDDASAPWGRALAGSPAGGRLVDRDAVFVPMGPPDHPWVLAVEASPARHRDVHLLASLRALAHETWLAVQRTELVNDLEGQLEILTAITAVAGVTGVDLDEIVGRLGRLTGVLLHAGRVGIYLLDDEGIVRVAHRPGVGADGAALGARGVGERHEVTAVDPADRFLEAPWRAEDDVTDLLVAPLRVGGGSIGSIVVARTDGAPPFSQQTRQVFAALSQQAALAVGHARLFEREQATVNRLRELDELKADYVAGVSHDLKSPLTSMLGFATTLRRFGDDLPADERARYLGAIERQARRLVAMAEDLVLAGRMEHGHVEPGRIDELAPAELLLEAVEELDPDRRERVHLVDVAAGGRLRGDRPHLLRVLTNLLDNALKYGGEDQPVEVSAQVDETTATITVRDHGPGVPEADHEALFDRYRRGRAGEEQGSTGLGLYISRGIARGHGGDLVVAPTAQGTGATFRLTLPLAPRRQVPGDSGP